MSEINKTDYTIQKTSETLTVFKNGKVEAKGFIRDDDALHAIWVIEGKVYDDFYVVNDGIVSRVDRGAL